MTDSTPGYGEYPQPPHRQGWGEPELKRYVGVLRRRIWVVVTAFVIVATLGAVYAFKATPIYQGVAKVLIEKQSPRLMNFQDVVQMEVADQDYYKTQEELVQSRAVLERALAQPGVAELPEVTGEGGGQPSLLGRMVGEVTRTISAVLGLSPASPPEPWERLRKYLEVEQVRDTHLLLVKVESENAARAAQLANAVAGSFEKYHVERKRETTNEAFLFLDEKQKQQGERLAQAEDALQQFREQAQVVSLDVADKGNPVLVRLDQLNDQLTKAQLQRIELEAQFLVVEKALKNGGEAAGVANESLFSLPAVRADPAVSALRTSLVEAEKELATLSDTYGPQHPQLQAVAAKVNLLRAKLEDALSQLVGSLSAQLQMLSNQEQELRQQYDEQNQLALELSKQSLTFSRLQSEVERQRRLFDVLVERMREVDVTAGYAKTNVEVVDQADTPKVPVRPKKARTVILSLVLGLFLGVCSAFFFEYLDDTVKTPEDLEERVGIPVLGFVPDMDTKRVSMDGFSYRGVVSMVEPTSSAAEAYRNIRTSLFFSAPAEETKVLVITSGGPGDGKTTTATNLALIIAQSGKRVLLVDADFRKPMVHKVFNLESKVGLSTVLVGEAGLEEAVQKARRDGKVVENLDILAAGPKPPNPAELLDSEATRRFLNEARQAYDRIILDTPPVLFVADASIVSAIADGVIMVVKSATNTRSLAARAREQLAGVKARILGGILNDVIVSRLGYYYSDYYYYGYSRYHRDYYRSYPTGDEQKSEEKNEA
jgi:succinoglycan biosynthesis transport protein ExoP